MVEVVLLYNVIRIMIVAVDRYKDDMGVGETG